MVATARMVSLSYPYPPLYRPDFNPKTTTLSCPPRRRRAISSSPFTSLFPSFSAPNCNFRLEILSCSISSSNPSSSSSSSSPEKKAFNPSTKLYVSGLSFRTTEESLTNAFKNFGRLLEVNLVMDKIANRPRGFAFLRYATEEESKKAIEGMHGKFLDGRVIFVEVAKPRSELRQGLKHNARQY